MTTIGNIEHLVDKLCATVSSLRTERDQLRAQVDELKSKFAEKDLELRGGGELLGLKQSGDADYRVATAEQLVRLLPVAHDDARLFVERDGGMEGARGEAVRLCLYLFERDAAVPLLRSG